MNASLNSKVFLYSEADILSVEVDARVNTDNYSESPPTADTPHCAVGDAIISENTNFSTPAKFDIYTEGPRIASNTTWEEAEMVLVSCYRRCLYTLKKNELRTVAFIGIGTGPYSGLTRLQATHIALRTTRDWLDTYGNAVDGVVFCQREGEYSELMNTYFPR